MTDFPRVDGLRFLWIEGSNSVKTGPAVVSTAKRTAVRFFPVRLVIALRDASGITLYSAGSIMEYLVFMGTVKSDLKYGYT